MSFFVCLFTFALHIGVASSVKGEPYGVEVICILYRVQPGKGWEKCALTQGGQKQVSQGREEGVDIAKNGRLSS